MVVESEINSFLQEQLRKKGLRQVSIAEASRWLDDAGILKENPSNPAGGIRRMLRNNLLEGQFQDNNGRWYIQRSDLFSVKPSRA